MKNYNDVLKHLLVNGERRETRNGVTYADFALQLEWDLNAGFPAVTTKRLDIEYVWAELIWFLQGAKNGTAGLNYVRGKALDAPNIWTPDSENYRSKGAAQYPGDVGRIYGAQWTEYRGIGPDGQKVTVNQLENLIKILKTDKTSRYGVITAWNPAELPQMALPACHMMAQFFVRNDGRLECSMVQRSADFFLGVPFNIASYALLTHLLAWYCDLTPSRLQILFQDYHIYEAHIPAVLEQVRREPRALPSIVLNIPTELKALSFTELCAKLELSHLNVHGYTPHEKIKAPLLTAVTKEGATTF